MEDRVLIVDDEAIVLEFLRELLEGEGHIVHTARSAADALRLLDQEAIPLALCDIRMPEMDGYQLLREIRMRQGNTDVLLRTAFASMDGAIQAMAQGAADYLIKPLKPMEVVAKVRSHLLRKRNEAELKRLQDRLDSDYTLDKVIAQSAPMRAVIKKLELLAKSDQPLVFVGEMGSGRNYLAQTLHHSSSRRQEPYRILHCDAGAPRLAEPALFDSGGNPPRRYGTLHLRRVERLPHEEQRSVGQLLASCRKQERSPSVRLVLSFDQPVPKLLENRALAGELTALLECPTIHVPPLRERSGDMSGLVAAFLDQHSRETGQVLRVPEPSLSLLQREKFPGNVAQLFATLSHCASQSTDGVLSLERIRSAIDRPERLLGEAMPMSKSLEDHENQLVLRAVNKHRGRLELAARELGVSRTTLWRRMRKYGITAQGTREDSRVFRAPG
jgi:two-component system response regulator HydG